MQVDHTAVATISGPSRWNQTRIEWATGVFMAMTAGYLDGYGLQFLKLFVSFMSGNTTTAGLKTGQGQFTAAVPLLVAIFCFLAGSFFGNLLSQSKIPHSHRVMFGLVALGIAGVAALEAAGLRHAPSEIAVMCLAMGMMNPALSKIGAEAVSLTFVTGTLSRIGGHLASAAGRKTLKDPQGPKDSHWNRVLIEASIWCGFFGGAILSGVAGHNSRTWGLLPPFVVMILLGAFSESATPVAAKTSAEAVPAGSGTVEPRKIA